VCAGGMQHTIGKLSRRATTLLETSLRIEVGARSYGRPNSRESKPGQFWDHFGNPGKKCHSDASAVERHREYYMGGRWWLPPSSGHGESSESKVARDLSQHQKGAK